MQIVDLMEDEAWARHVTLRMIATGRIKTDDDSKALELAGTITDAYDQAVAFREIGLAQANAGKPASAESFQKAFEAACRIEIGGGTDVCALREIGSAQAAAGDIASAAKTFEEARKTAFRYEDESYVAVLVQDVAQAQAEGGGDAARALTWATAKQSPIVKALSLVGVAQGMIAASGGPQKASPSP